MPYMMINIILGKKNLISSKKNITETKCGVSFKNRAKL